MFESLPERLIREAMERGAFDDLPGHGKPIPGSGRPDDPNWWVHSLLDRERAQDDRRARYQRLEIRVGTLVLATSEATVRASIDRINDEIAEIDAAGALQYERFDVEDVVSAWKSARRARRRSAPGGLLD